MSRLKSSLVSWLSTPLSPVYQKGVVVLVTLSIIAIEIAASLNSALLPNMRTDLVISEQLAQATISATLMALSLSGLLYGVLSQSYGRRPVILGGLTLFCLGALGSALAPTVEILLVARVIQGFGAGVGWIVGNACLKDLFDGKDYTRVMNQVHAVAGIVPAVAPTIGSYLASWMGWRFCFFAIFFLALIVLCIKLRKLPETHFKKTPFVWRHLIFVYGNLFRNLRYVLFTLIKALAVAMLFVEAANIPLIFVEHLGVASQDYGLYTIPVFLIYVVGSYLSGLLASRCRVELLLGVGLLCVIISNGFIIYFEQSDFLTAWEIQALKMMTYLGWGFIFGNATAALIEAVPGQAGAASAMMIALEMLLSSLGIYVVGLFFTGSIVPLAIFMVIVSLSCGIFLVAQFFTSRRSV